jgi:hypothetical protein
MWWRKQRSNDAKSNAYGRGYEQSGLLSVVGGLNLKQRRDILTNFVDEFKDGERGKETTNEQISWIQNRWKELVLLFLKHGQKDRRRFLSFRYIAAVGALIIPVLASFNAASGKPSDTVRYATLAVSLIVAAATASQVFRFGQRWRLDSQAADEMESAGWRFLTGVGSKSSGKEAFDEFFDEVEGIVQKRADDYRAEVISNVDPAQQTAASDGDQSGSARSTASAPVAAERSARSRKRPRASTR